MAVSYIVKYSITFFALLLCPLAIAGDASDIYQKTKNSVFIVRALNAQSEVISQGSAVAVSENQLITNWHVVSEASSVTVSSGGIELKVEVKGKIENLDLAVLYQQALKLSPAKLQVATPLEGENIFAIGAPRGLEKTISEGIISSIRQDKHSTVYQLTAPISPGSSGGGLFNDEAELIGITTSQVKSGQNLNFAIPIKYISREIEIGKKDDSGVAFEALRDDYLVRPTTHAASSLIISYVDQERAFYVDMDSLLVSGSNIVFDEFIRWETGENDYPPAGAQQINHVVTDCKNRMTKKLSISYGNAYSSSVPRKMDYGSKEFEWDPVFSSDKKQSWMVTLCEYRNDLAKAKEELFLLHMTNLMYSPMFAFSVFDLIVPTEFTDTGEIAHVEPTILQEFWQENSIYSKKNISKGSR